MAQITSGVGLISGIDTSQIIDELISLDSAPITQLQSEIDTGTEQQDAFTQLTTDLNNLQTVGKTLSDPDTFGASTANSSDPTTLTATAGSGAAVGTYQLQVARLVSSQQAVTNGFADPSQTKVGAGTITISEGGGELNTPTTLASLNGGQGVNSGGEIRITDRSGQSQIIDLSSAVTLDDVAQAINNALDISVKATVTQNGLVLTDETGQTTDNLTVQDVGTGQTAEQLGIAQSVAASTLTGSAINTIGTATALSQLNGGSGVSTSTSGADFQITAGDGRTFSISLANNATLGDVINTINTATGGKVTAAINSTGSALQLTDSGGGTVSVAALNGSQAAAYLGIAGSATGTLTGSSLTTAIDTTLVSALNGGQGIPLGQIKITDRSGNAATVDLSGARTIDDILNDINNAGIGVQASLNAASDGIQIADTSGGTGDLTISDVNSTTAAALGIAGSFATSTPVVSGANLHPQYISENTDLSALNGGKGISQGSFTITNSKGASTTMDLTSGSYTTLGDLITAINARDIGVTASINSTGNGLLLTDTAGGSGTMTVADTTGTPAADLNLIPSGSTTATAVNGQINGAYQATIAVTANDTLQTVEQKINSLGFGVSASIINDGSGATPYRLSLSANNSGEDGRFVFDAGTTGLTTRNLVQAQDAAVFVGGQGAAQPLLVTSSSNQITNVVNGVTISLQNVSSTPVTLTVARDPTAISTQLQSFVSDFNTIVTALNSYTSFDTTTNTGGILLGDETTQTIQEDLYNIFNSVVPNAGQYKVFSDIGITIGDDSMLSFDQNAFNAAYAADPTAVQNLFSQATTGLGNVINNTVNDLTDPSNGLITLESQTISTRNTQFQDRINELDNIIAQKKELLTEQFANMEQVLAQLQSQQSALSSLSGTKSTATTSASTGALSSVGSDDSDDDSSDSSDSASSTGSTDSSDSTDSGDTSNSGSSTDSTSGS
jgi:flagellar hook-associated protein 2